MADQEGQATAAEAATGDSRATLKDGRGGILGIKAGMTQIFTDEGDSLAVTVIDLKPTVVTQLKTKAKEGYNAVQVGILEKKAKSANKAEAGHAKAAGKAFYHYQEFRFASDAKLEGLTVGATLSPDFIKVGDLVDVSSQSKGKGYQGGMKRFHMAGGFKSHGASVCHRSLGSIGNRADPGKTFKNKKMPGQMGNARTTVQNVKVARVDVENGLLLVHGSVPGPRTGIVTVRLAVKGPSGQQGKR